MGIVARQEKQIATLTGKLDDLLTRSMSDNLVISGLLIGDSYAAGEVTGSMATDLQETDCVQVVYDFFTEYLQVDVEKYQILQAYRFSRDDTANASTPNMYVRCYPTLCEKVLAKAKSLKDKPNSKGNAIFINQQMPEVTSAIRKENAHIIKKVWDANQGKPPNQSMKYQIKNKQVIVDDVPVKKQVFFPTVEEVFPEQAKQNKIEKVFTAIAAKTSSLAEVKRAYRKVHQLYPSATHISVGYDC